MRTSSRNTRARHLVTVVVLAASLGLILTGFVAVATAAATSTFTPDGAATELTRLLNGERTTHGLPALAVDPFLASEARDGSVACPDGSGAMAGRAKDMAVNDFFSHSLRLCPTYDVGDAMRAWGYSSYLGEIIAMNGGYGFDSFPYEFGCDVAQANCGGETTSAPTTVAIASYQFMTSQGHRDVVLSSVFDRFACGAWETANGAFYACMFAFGPGTAEVPSPTPTPPPPAIPDVTPPTMTTLSAPSLVTSADATFTATFAGSDDIGVTSYEVRTRRGATGTWSIPAPQTAASRVFSGLGSGTWYIDVRARDAADHVSAWREVAVVVPTDDRSWSFSGGNTRRTSPSYIRGTATSTQASGATMRVAFSGTSFSLLGTTGRYYGKLRISLDGHSYTVDTGYVRGVRATANHYRVLLFSRALTNGRHTVVVTCLATPGRRMIAIDAAGWRN